MYLNHVYWGWTICNVCGIIFDYRCIDMNVVSANPLALEFVCPSCGRREHTYRTYHPAWRQIPIVEEEFEF